MIRADRVRNRADAGLRDRIAAAALISSRRSGDARTVDDHIGDLDPARLMTGPRPHELGTYRSKAFPLPDIYRRLLSRSVTGRISGSDGHSLQGETRNNPNEWERYTAE